MREGWGGGGGERKKKGGGGGGGGGWKGTEREGRKEGGEGEDTDSIGGKLELDDVEDRGYVDATRRYVCTH